jgi:hypothetical protein
MQLNGHFLQSASEHCAHIIEQLRDIGHHRKRGLAVRSEGLASDDSQPPLPH